jgi:hypothetical protein
MLLYWSFISFAADNGYSFFDFGRSTPNEGTYKFKKQWGAISQPLYWEKSTKKNNDFSLTTETNIHTNGQFRVLAERIIQHLPTNTATVIGSRLRKYIVL